MKLSIERADIPHDVFEDHYSKLESYRAHLTQIAEEGGYTKPECSINVPFDKSILSSCENIANQVVNDQLKYIVIVGMGGATLGTKAVYDALFGYTDILNIDRYPKIIFFDTLSTSLVNAFKTLVKESIQSAEEIVVNCVSKSGTTTESVANIEVVLGILQDRFGESASSRVIITTDANSPMFEAAEDQNLHRIVFPTLVGDRYSVFTAVGLLPFLLLAISTERLLAGAKSMRDKCLLKSGDNPAMQSAAVLYHHITNERNIHDLFLFHSELESVGKWYRQLSGESLGKDIDTDGNKIDMGITPTVSLGPTDLHSVGQLYLGGPMDKITTFVSIHKEGKNVSVPTRRHFPDITPMVSEKSIGGLLSAILKGTKIAYQKKEVPFMEVELQKVDEYSLGAFMQFKMMEIMYLGHLMKIDAFNQPAVEAYKSETKRLLEQDGVMVR
jgi:glucose-6-phosphate isomerase